MNPVDCLLIHKAPRRAENFYEKSFPRFEIQYETFGAPKFQTSSTPTMGNKQSQMNVF